MWVRIEDRAGTLPGGKGPDIKEDLSEEVAPKKMEDESTRPINKGWGDLEVGGTMPMEPRGRSLRNFWIAWLSRGICGKLWRRGCRSRQWLDLQGVWLVKEFGLYSVDVGWQICGLRTTSSHCCA